MNSKAIRVLKNISYSFSSNFISLIVSVLVILIIPKLLGLEEYGYWQLYLFYSAFVGFLHFGWNDGIYLRYGGKDYHELDKKKFYSQFLMLVGLQGCISIIVLIISNYMYYDVNKVFIIQMIGITLFIVNVRYMLLYTLQATNCIKIYSNITIFDRTIYIVIIILFLIIGVRDYKLMIYADILAKLLSLTYALICCKEIVFRKFSDFTLDTYEILQNVSVGIKLMLANISSTLIIGIVRFGIERTWNVATFGKISIILSISNMAMLFINAVGIVMFPLLRKTPNEKLSILYLSLRETLSLILVSLLLLYYPIKIVLTGWLPQYTESFRYLALIFPMIVYEGNMALLLNTYMKTLRREKYLLLFNITVMMISIVLTFINTFVLNSLELTIVSIVVLLAIRSIVIEFYLSYVIKISVFKNIFTEFCLIILFILSSWYIQSWHTFLVFSFGLLVYLLLKRKEIINSLKYIISLLK